MTEQLVNLLGRVALVTGAGHGQGAEHARLFARLGARLVLTDLDGPAVAAVAESLSQDHDVLALQHDVRSAQDWSRVMSQMDSRFGRCDILVNNAGLFREQPLVDLDEDILRALLDVNLVGPVLGMRAVAPVMRRHGGSIVNIASTAALSAYPGGLAYGASKWALRGASRSAARELGAWGIRVNSVCPGAIDTDMLASAARSGRDIVANQPLARVGRSAEVSALVAFLASDASSYCTGHDYVVDGGLKA